MNKKMIAKAILYSDGGARGNPGPAGIGAVLYSEDMETIFEISEYLGETTNNQAEYRALLAGIKKARELGIGSLDCFLDSELVVKQLKREYKVKNKDLAPLFVKIYNLSLEFEKISFNHVRREKNKKADELANLAMDKHL